MDDFERELHRMLNERVADMPETYEATPELVARVQRRRTIKLASIGVAALVVVIGTVGAVAQSVGQSDSHLRVAKPSSPNTTPTRPSVATVRCPIEYSLTGNEFAAPSTVPRVPTAGDPALLEHLASYAATTDPRYIVLAPVGWSCKTTVAADGQNGMGVTPAGSTSSPAPSIAILNDYLWHGGVGAPQACTVFDQRELMTYVKTNFPESVCHHAGRTITRVDDHVVTFVDADGSRGAGWMVLPSSITGPDDGKLSLLFCRPGGALTVADCDTIIADFIARNDVTNPSAPGIPAGQVPGVACGAAAGSSVPPRTPAAGDPARYSELASYLANVDGDPRFAVLGPRSWSCEEATFEDGRAAELVFDPAAGTTPSEESAPIAIDHDWLWHGGVGSVAACSIFDDQVVTDYVSRLYPKSLPCPRAGRTVTRVNARRVATFVDADGAWGVGWMILPSAQGVDGFITVLTCRPTTGLTPADCDTIVADYAARADAPAGGSG